MWNKRTIETAVLISLTLVLMPAASHGIDFGVRGGVYTDIEEPFAGVELLMPVGASSWYFNPNAEFVAVSDGDLATVNFDFHYDIPVDAPLYVWAGGGPAVIFRDPPGRRSDDETDVGANLLVGVGWQDLPVVPYVQAKIIVSDETEVVAAVGVRF
ncbi:MAG: hypothetical protein R3234_10355 [Thermoanaerobaculia bacterium]|nr:hypothetical protein [Thermoanaerobaculia bacterium]